MTGQQDAQRDDELERIVADTQAMAKRLSDRAANAYLAGDAETVRWLHKRLVAVERAAQERTTTPPEGADGTGDER